MRRLTRIGLAAVVATASLSALAIATPAQAAGSGLQLTIVAYNWVPRTGNLEVTAKVDCPRQIWSASWSLTVKQRVSAKGFQRFSCTGDTQRLTLVLDPRNGRFRPGEVTQDLTTVECRSDVCAGLIYPTTSTRIPPPGHHHTPGAR